MPRPCAVHVHGANTATIPSLGSVNASACMRGVDTTFEITEVVVPIGQHLAPVLAQWTPEPK